MGGLLSRVVQSFWGSSDVRILMVGLDAAGKTTILYKLKLGELVSTIPTIGFNVESVEYKNLTFTIWDIGGQGTIRPLWRYYFQNSQGLVFVVDSADMARVQEVKEELHSLLKEDELRDAAVLVLANKQDLPNAVSAGTLEDALGLRDVRSHQWHVQAATAKTAEGLYEGLDWLARTIKNRA